MTPMCTPEKIKYYLCSNLYIIMNINHTGIVFFGTEAKPYKEEVVIDSIVDSVVKQFKDRSKVGIDKYGTTMDRKDLSTLEWMIHFREELQDGLLYLERIIQDTQNKGWYDEKLEDRINIVGQNGNTGEHY